MSSISRRRRLHRFTALATGTALALGALTGTAAAGSTAAGTATAAGRSATTTAGRPTVPVTPRGTLFARKTAATRSRPATTATTSAWAEPGSLTVQTYGMAVDSSTVDGQDYTEIVPMVTGTAEYRQLIDLGRISSTKGDDFLAITESGQLRLLPAGYARPSSKFVSLGGGWQTYNQVLTVGDLNGDGRADLMARDTHGKLWFYGSKAGASAAFHARVQVGTGWNMYDQLIGAANFDGSGRGSLLARDLQGRLWLYSGHSNGTLAARREVGTGWNMYNQLLGLDWNGDGSGDIVGRTEDGQLWDYQGNGTGALAGGRTQIGTGWASYNAIAGEGHQPDFGKGEIFARRSNGDFYWYVALENGRLPAGQLAGSGFDPKYWPAMTATVSLDDTGMPALLAGSPDSLWNLNAPGAGTVPSYNFNVVFGPGDVTGDGHGDVIGRDHNGHLWLVPGNGSGNVGAKAVSMGAGWNTYNRIVGAGDLSGDGIPDFVATTPSGAMYLYRGLGNGGFAARVYIGYGWQGYTRIIALGDITGDGKSDLAGVDSAGRLWLYPGRGNNTFAAREEIGTAGWNSFHDIS